eukprot:jgi/Mesvir1/5200/Mv15332-RA.1
MKISALFVAVLWIASYFSGLAFNIWFKVDLFVRGVVHFVLTGDKKKHVMEYDPKIVESMSNVARKRFLLIRHGESVWNEVFNRGFGPSFVGRLIKALIKEWKLMITQDSVFYDSNLNGEGIEQAVELSHFLEHEAKPWSEVSEPNPANLETLLAVLVNGDADNLRSVVVTSNLRRAIETCSIALRNRLQKTKEKVIINSDLQEITFNVDGIALALPGQAPELGTLSDHTWASFQPDKVFDCSWNMGTKPLDSNGFVRSVRFLEWAFGREEDIIIASGHSLYFRNLFKTFLPRDVQHPGKQKKIVNGGAVALTVIKGIHKGQSVYMIDPDSIQVIRGGFSK